MYSPAPSSSAHCGSGAAIARCPPLVGQRTVVVSVMVLGSLGRPSARSPGLCSQPRSVEQE
jgi:hypothetical protein